MLQQAWAAALAFAIVSWRVCDTMPFEHVQWLSLVSSVVAEPAAAAARDAACAADS